MVGPAERLPTAESTTPAGHAPATPSGSTMTELSFIRSQAKGHMGNGH